MTILNLTSYIIITPVRNEEHNIEKTIVSVLAQTALPRQWIIVDDGSEDRTAEIIDRYVFKHPWIYLIRRTDRGCRKLGGGVIEAFNMGLSEVCELNWKYIAKLDGDLQLPPDYFERLMEMFISDSELGIASGVYQEQSNGIWSEIKMPSYHAAGASKLYRRETFERINGLVENQGWDTIDEIKAMNNGWKTKHFETIKFKHLKKEGSSLGAFFTNRFHGKIYYKTGGGILFFFAKIFHRTLFGKPPVLAGVLLATGYLEALLSSEPRMVSREERKLYRRLLNRRLFSFIHPYKKRNND